jgi:hypothetical protein
MHRLADNALFEAFLCGRKRVLRADVERAHRDLGFAAAPEVRVDRPATAASGPPSRERDAELERLVEAPELEPAAEAPELESRKPIAPFADDDSLGDLDSELEAIFEGAEEGPPRRLRVERGGSLIAELLEE